MVVDICINEQRIFINDYKYIVNDSIGYVYCHFCFSDDWFGQKTAIFKTDDKKNVYHVLIDENNICEVPSDALKGAGFYLSAFCGDLITADEIFIKTEKSGYELGGKPPPPEEDVYTQIIKMINQISVEGGGGILEETDPTVPDWAKEKEPPTAQIAAMTNEEIWEMINS